jgi:hypothetical protein
MGGAIVSLTLPLDEPVVSTTIAIVSRTAARPTMVASFARDRRLPEACRACVRPRATAPTANSKESVGIQTLVSSPKMPRTTPITAPIVLVREATSPIRIEVESLRNPSEKAVSLSRGKVGLR